jgi:polar amino acid transport system substrate-binding protein
MFKNCFRTRPSMLSGIVGVVSIGLAAHGFAAECRPPFPDSHLVTAGQLQMSTNPTLPPQQYVNDRGELQGLNVDLGRDIAAQLCLKATFIRMDMPPMIPALRTGRFDAIDTGLFYTEERSKLFYMVPYAQQALSVYTLPGGHLEVKGFDDLAGLRVGVEISTYQEKRARVISDEMVRRGLKPIQFFTFTTVTDTEAALKAGQIDAAINIDETATDLADRGLARIWLHGMYGTDITLAFRDKVVAQAAADALTRLKANGEYGRLFTRYKMTPLQLKVFTIRGTGPV